MLFVIRRHERRIPAGNRRSRCAAGCFNPSRDTDDRRAGLTPASSPREQPGDDHLGHALEERPGVVARGGCVVYCGQHETTRRYAVMRRQATILVCTLALA